MAAARFLLVHPDGNAYPSGGNQFNRRMIEQARSQGWRLRSVVADPAICHPSSEAFAAQTARLGPPRLMIIWDSLFLGTVPPRPRNDVRQALLLHFLPSQNPLLSSGARAGARSAEDRWIERMDCVITTGKCLENCVGRRYPAVRVYRCEPGVDDLFWQVGRCDHRFAGGVLRLLSVGNLTAAKGYGEVLDALGPLTCANWRWHIAGSDRPDVTFAARFLERVAPWSSAGRIVYHGALSDIELAGLMSQVDVFVSASHYESYGMALAEAVTAGLPVVTTDVGDAVSIAREARASWVLPAGDSEALARVLEEVVSALARIRMKTGATAGRPFPDWSEAFARFRGICETEAGLAFAP